MIPKLLHVAATSLGVLAVVSLSGSAVADTHADGAGRLSAASGSGGFTLDAPAVHHAYWGSFGEWVLCDTARDGGSPAENIKITGVRYVFGKHKPVTVRAYLRRVTPQQVKSHPHAAGGVYSPFGGLLGRAPGFTQPYVHRKWVPPGHYTRGIAGIQVLRGCDTATDDAYADGDGKVPKHSWIGLVLAVKVGRQGALVHRTLIDYKVGDTAHTLRISWAVGGQGYLR